MKNNNSSKNGSVLLLTLLVVSLLLVLVLSFTVYVRIELRSTSNRIDLIQARQNAKLALHLALAQLQKTAGEDRRVSARAEILGPSINNLNRFVTGIWNTQEPNDPPVWLISTPTGTTFSPTTAPIISESALLIEAGVLGTGFDPNDRILAPLVEINSPYRDGHYAWWISDEGVKASLSLNDPFPATNTIQQLTSTELERLRYTVPVRNAQELAFSPSLDFDASSANSFTSVVLDLEQYALFSGLSDPREDGGIHDYTHRATGLLTHPIDGGIKKDLSLAPSLLGAGFEQFMDFTSYLQTPTSSHSVIKTTSDLRRAHRITPPSNYNPSNGEIVHSVSPIITDFGLQFSPRRDTGSGEASLMMAVVLELWNPYSTALAQEDLILEISGFQPIEMTLRDDLDTLMWADTFDPNTIFSDTISIRLGQEQFHSETYVYLEDGAYDMELHGPGRLLYWTGPDQDHPNQASFASRRSNLSRLQGSISPSIIFPMGGDSSNYRVGYKMDPTTLTVRLRRAPENGGEILREHTTLSYDDVDTIDYGTLSQWGSRWLTYRFRMIERGTTAASDPSSWLKNIDKRTPSPSFGDSFSSNTHTMIEEATSYAPDDSELMTNLSLDQDGEEYYFDRVLSNSDWSTSTYMDAPLFELPRQPLLSVGQLQHVYIHGMPPYSIGNPWGGSTWNRLFDDYFLSGIQRSISEPDFLSTAHPQLPHPRLQLAEPGDLEINAFDTNTFSTLGENAALALQVKGQFNLNSVSVQAWETVLAGMRFADMNHLERDSNLHDSTEDSTVLQSDVDFPSGFTRFPQSVQELFEFEIPSFNLNYLEIMMNFKNTITFLTPRVAFTGADSDYDDSDISKIEDMAEEIVSAIKERTASNGHPFYSINDFLTEPYKNGNTIIEEAIEVAGLHEIALPGGSEITAEERTPSWLSQADVMTALSPFLSTRSDTFVIRAYGDLSASNGNTASQAWCEAVVQRVITPIESGASLADMANPPSSPYGRKFKIISFKWLSKSEI
ncbi:hypothetical protein P3T73_05015 [Kiritimatiellota bacterium B12222]|nr:hypothetical protein P3T73_05015 [Kiritimatiellota bacterium B12222]